MFRELTELRETDDNRAIGRCETRRKARAGRLTPRLSASILREHSKSKIGVRT